MKYLERLLLSIPSCLLFVVFLAVPTNLHAYTVIYEDTVLGESGGDGQKGLGGEGGFGGTPYPYGMIHGGNGGYGGPGGDGAKGGTGVLDILTGNEFSNYGHITIGGSVGDQGNKGVNGEHGWDGGIGGRDNSYRPTSGAIGEGPYGGITPPYLTGVDGFRGGTGVTPGSGGSGGGGGTSLFLVTGIGGHGGSGRPGAGGDGSNGTPANSTQYLSGSGRIDPQTSLQIGGTGGSAGEGGDGGGGGGGAGGHGYTLLDMLLNTDNYKWRAPGKGGYGAWGGRPGLPGPGGDGYLNVHDQGLFINRDIGEMEVGSSSGRGAIHIYDGGTLKNQGNLTVKSKGTISIDNGGVLINEGGTLENGGGMLTNNGVLQSQATIVNKGLYSGSGEIHGGFTNQGQLSPGNSPGSMTIVGTYEENGFLEIELGGLFNYDFIEIWGDVEIGLDSMLGLVFYDTFSELALNDGDQFDLIRYNGALSGEFGLIDTTLASLSYGYWDLNYNADLDDGWNSVRLSYISFDPIPVSTPEPSTLLLFTIGLFTMFAVVRKLSIERGQD